MTPSAALVVLDLAYSWISANAETRADIELAEEVLQAETSLSALVVATQRTAAAFDALGKAENFIDSHRARKECEAAMQAQANALTDIAPDTTATEVTTA